MGVLSRMGTGLDLGRTGDSEEPLVTLTVSSDGPVLLLIGREFMISR
jgi:hypothetical protein